MASENKNMAFEVDHLQGSFGPFGPKSESLEKGSRTLSAPGAQKVKNNGKLTIFQDFQGR